MQNLQGLYVCKSLQSVCKNLSIIKPTVDVVLPRGRGFTQHQQQSTEAWADCWVMGRVNGTDLATGMDPIIANLADHYNVYV